MQQQIQQQPAESLHATSGRPTQSDPFSTAAPRPPAQQQPAQHNSGGNPSNSGTGSVPAFAHGQQSDSDDDCADSATPHNAGNLADWVMSIAAKPRQGDAGSEAASSSGGSSNSSQHNLQQGQQLHRGGGWNHGGGASSGGRGRFVAALAVQHDEVSTRPAVSSGESAVLQLAPREEDCEPDWMMSPASSVSLAAFTMANSSRDTAAGELITTQAPLHETCKVAS